MGLDLDALRDVTGSLWTPVEVVAVTGSTNADLLRRGGPEGQVLVAESQTAGRGRMGRSWVSQPGASLTFSVLLRPVTVPGARRGWLPLLAGVAVAAAVRDAAAVAATLKWPNDVLVGSRKLAGILAEQSGDAVVVGIGLNVSTPAGEIPASPGGLRATSLAAEGASVSREIVLAGILRELERRYVAFRADPGAAPGGLPAEYRALCATLGRPIRVELPGGGVLSGVAEDIDADGRLLVAGPGGGPPSAVAAGDVIHVRLSPRVLGARAHSREHSLRVSMSCPARSLGFDPLRHSSPIGSALAGTGTLSRLSHPLSRSSCTACCGVIHTASESRVSARATETDCVSVQPSGNAMPCASKNPSVCVRGTVPMPGMTSG